VSDPTIPAEEPDEDSDVEQAAPKRSWLRRLFLFMLVLLIGTAIALTPYVRHLDAQVQERFGQLRWQIPTRVYARPLVLQAGQAMDAATLKLELTAAGYRNDGIGQQADTYAEQGNQFTISSRAHRGIDGPIAAQRISVQLTNKQVTNVLDADTGQRLSQGQLEPARIATLYGSQQEERRLVSLAEVPELLLTGLQAVEDQHFARHRGIDVTGMLRAAWLFAKSGGKTRQGASTLTQQLARSGVLGIGRERSFKRKFDEILYALIIEARYDKTVILETYLNQVYLGQRGGQAIHGVAAGAEYWFGRELDSLQTEHIALLIGLVKGPAYYDPRRYPQHAIDRRNLVLDRLLEHKLIDASEHQRARAAELEVSTTPGLRAANRFPAYIDLVRRQLANDYPPSALQGAGLDVFTALSPSAQTYAEQAISQTVQTLQTANRPELQAATVLTRARSGEVVAVVGSRLVDEPGFNRALEAQRPVGSLLKPFVYLLALAQPQRWSLASWVDDEPITVRLPNGRNWRPENADRQSRGPMRLIDALAHSRNQTTVRIGMDVDPRRLSQLMHALAGLEAEANPALILGATDQSPYNMAQLYQFLASGGQIQPLRAVRGVVDAQGQLLNRYDHALAPAQAGDSIAANLVSIALQHTVSSGTARRLNGEGLAHLHSAGKTGTSNDGRDSWFAGYTGEHLAVVWMGNDQNQPTGLQGASGAMRVWSHIFQQLPSQPLRVNNQGLDWQYIEAQGSASTDAQCPDARRFAFVSGFAPVEYTPCTAVEVIAEEEQNNHLPTNVEPNVPEQRRGFWRRLFRRE